MHRSGGCRAREKTGIEDELYLRRCEARVLSVQPKQFQKLEVAGVQKKLSSCCADLCRMQETRIARGLRVDSDGKRVYRMKMKKRRE